MEHLSPATSCSCWACLWLAIMRRAGAIEPRSIITGVMSRVSRTLWGLRSLWARGCSRECMAWTPSHICLKRSTRRDWGSGSAFARRVSSSLCNVPRWKSGYDRKGTACEDNGNEDKIYINNERNFDNNLKRAWLLRVVSLAHFVTCHTGNLDMTERERLVSIMQMKTRFTLTMKGILTSIRKGLGFYKTLF